MEVDVYVAMEPHCNPTVYLGIDIGSTSTKAVIVSTDQQVLAGFYTRTAGNPLAAVQAILAALGDLQQRKHASFIIQGAGTTGSGRKFIGALIGADLVVDEISAHARAAVPSIPMPIPSLKSAARMPNSPPWKMVR